MPRIARAELESLRGVEVALETARRGGGGAGHAPRRSNDARAQAACVLATPLESAVVPELGEVTALAAPAVATGVESPSWW